MTPLTPVLLTLATAALLIWLGYRWGSQTAAGETPATANALAWLGRDEAVDQLRALRNEMELDGQYGRIEALLLFDVAC